MNRLPTLTDHELHSTLINALHGAAALYEKNAAELVAIAKETPSLHRTHSQLAAQFERQASEARALASKIEDGATEANEIAPAPRPEPTSLSSFDYDLIADALDVLDPDGSDATRRKQELEAWAREMAATGRAYLCAGPDDAARPTAKVHIVTSHRAEDAYLSGVLHRARGYYWHHAATAPGGELLVGVSRGPFETIEATLEDARAIERAAA